MNIDEFKSGCYDGIPIGLGYLSVSFAFGVLCVSSGVDPITAVLISLLNLTSAGQFSGLSLMIAHASLLEVALSQFVINIRYALMSLSLSQKVEPDMNNGKRAIIAFGITDEIFALSSTKKGKLTFPYMVGLIIIPVLGWCSGTLCGALLMNVLPKIIQDALGIAIYGMFLAIIIPAAKTNFAIRLVLAIAIIVSTILYYTNIVSSGFSVIIAGVLAAGVAAYFYPICEEEAI